MVGLEFVAYSTAWNDCFFASEEVRRPNLHSDLHLELRLLGCGLDSHHHQRLGFGVYLSSVQTNPTSSL